VTNSETTCENDRGQKLSYLLLHGFSTELCGFTVSLLIGLERRQATKKGGMELF
jgi:hypothetical protein